MLDHSPTHTVRHEQADKHTAHAPEYWQPFPVERWSGGNYGECHGHLRRYLSPAYVGPERNIPRRAVLRRNVKDVIASWMNRRQRQAHDLPWIVRAVCRIDRLLVDYAASDPGCREIHLEDISGCLRDAQELVDWLELDFEVTPRMLLTRKNATASRWWEWDSNADKIFDALS
jgi:hypothetical protein